MVSKTYEYPLVLRLEALRDSRDRAALAKLRRGLGKQLGTPEMYPFVVPYLPDNKADQSACFLVASLFALNPLPAQRGVSFGNVWRQVWGHRDRSDSIEKRFTALLSCDRDDLAGHLRHAVALAKNDGVPIDFHRLLRDVRSWDHPDRWVQLSWARDFWQQERQDNTAQQQGEQS